MRPHDNPQDKAPRKDSSRRPRWLWFLAATCTLAILIGLLRNRHGNRSVPTPVSAETTTPSATVDAPRAERARSQPRPRNPAPTPTAEETVAAKLKQFTRSRQEIVRAMAKRNGVEVSADVDQFFDAVEAGRWEEMQALYDSMRARRERRPPARD